MKKRASWCSGKEEVMSLSKIFRSDDLFVPKKLLPDPPPRDEIVIPTPIPESPAPLQEKPEQVKTTPRIPDEEERIDNTISPEPEPHSSPPPDIEAIRNEAYRLGAEEGKNKAQLEFAGSIQALADSCTQLDTLQGTILEKSREEMINLIIAVAKNIIYDELKTSRNTIAHVLEESLQAAIQSEEIHITLNPEDLRLAAQNKPHLISTIRGLNSIVLKSDPLISIGGCKLESNVCEIDATVETRLDTIKEHLKNNSGEQKTSEPITGQNQDQDPLSKDQEPEIVNPESV